MKKPLMDSATQEKLESLLNKRNVLIALIDSGLGGLSICAEMEQALHRQPLFQKVSLVYFNVWPEQDRGYNTLPSVAERVRVFNNALNSIKAYKPDLVMIACNTLSILYERTAFCRETSIPVVDIIDFGVDLIHTKLSEVPDSQALILGTRTTISENSHKERLVQSGIDAGRIKTQTCHGVATEIERDPDSKAVVDLIDGYMRKAAAKIKDKQSTVLAALCCTHFGYSSHIFLQKIKTHIAYKVEVMNPNTMMSNYLFELGSDLNFSKSDVDIRVISKIVLDEDKIRSISYVIRGVSARAADALVNYESMPDLFTL
jgi:glutamate racemase